MRHLNRSVASLFFVCIALQQLTCAGQQLQQSFKTRVVYERVLEQGPKDVPQDYRKDYFKKSNRGILTRLGTELLLNDPANHQILVVDVKTLAEIRVPLAFPATEVQTEAQTDMLFVNTYENSTGAEATQTCYENLNALKNGQPRWTLKLDGMFHRQQIRWLSEHKRFIVYSLHNGHRLVLLDEQGKPLAEHDIKAHILIVGVDESEDGFNIFYLTNHRVNRELALTRMDGDFKVRTTEKWPLVKHLQNWGASSLGISRDFRLRGLKSGEVTKYFLETATQPGHLDMNDRLPVANLKSKLFGYANKLSAAESPQQPEILIGYNFQLLDFDEFILFDRQSNYYHAPNQYLSDATFDDERKMIVTVSDTKKRGFWKVQLISFE